MDFSISITNGTDSDLLELIEQYWEFEEDKFVNSPKQIANENNLTITDLNNLIKKHSTCTLMFGACQDCTTIMTKDVFSQSAVKANKNNKRTRCSNCDTEYWKNKEARRVQLGSQLIKSKEEKFELAMANRSWTQLSDNEFAILKGLLQNKSKKLVYKNVFHGDPYNKVIWDIVEKLENLGLVYVMRVDRSVNGFDFPEELHKHLELKSSVEKPTYFSFSLDTNKYKTKPNQPEYSGTFTLSEEVVLQANVKYIYGGWINTDGSIHFKFQPESNVKNKIHQTRIESEPQHIKDILEDMNEDFNFTGNDETPF